MADSKKTKVTKNAVEVKSLTDLHKELASKKQDLLDSKKSHRSGELVNPRVLGTLKKEIARLLTAIRAEELKSQKESK